MASADVSSDARGSALVGGCAPGWCPSCWSYSAGSPAEDVTSSDGRILGTDTNIRLICAVGGE